MNKQWEKFIFLGVLILTLGGCHRFPESVNLIAPEDGAAFSTEAPVFVWSEDPLADSYVIRIVAGDFNTGAALVQDTFIDTTWQMSNEILLQIYQGTYEWAVAPLPAEDEPVWSEVWSFTVDKSLPGILISPEDGAEFSNVPPTFLWKEIEPASSYVIRIVKDAFFTGEVILVDTLTDTTYTMPHQDFEIALNADYVWSVAPEIQGGITWREFRNITFDKPMPSLDLDTTYFPLGLNYEWTYERHLWGYDASDPYNPDPPEWDYHDTITVKVVDSIFGLNGWEFYLEGYRFRDVDDTVYIFGNRVLLFDSEKLPLSPEATGPIGNNQGVEIIYSSDTLHLAYKLSETWEPYGGSWSERVTSRIKGIGVVSQLCESGSYGHGWGEESNIVDTLLYFYNGKDTVWRRDGP